MTRLEVGRVGRAHGLDGEVLISFSTNRPERRATGAILYAGARRLVVESSRPHHDRWLIRFRDVSDRDAAEALRGVVLTADALGSLPAGEHWVHELVGAEARDRADQPLGRVVAVESNPASDLLVLDDGKLIPLTFVVELDVGIVVVDPPEGLLD